MNALGSHSFIFSQLKVKLFPPFLNFKILLRLNLKQKSSLFKVYMEQSVVFIDLTYLHYVYKLKLALCSIK